MNVAEYLLESKVKDKGKALLEMHERYLSHLAELGLASGAFSIGKFAFEPFTRYAWDKGDLVKFRLGAGDKVFLVEGWSRLDDTVTFVGTDQRAIASALERADIPPEILEIAKAQLKSQMAGRCPLKEQTCLA